MMERKVNTWFTVMPKEQKLIELRSAEMNE